MSAGWHPDPSGRAQERYWDGTTWTEQTRPYAAPDETSTTPAAPPVAKPQPSTSVSPQGIGWGILIISLVGLVLTFQTVSVASGMSIVWIGFVITVAVLVVAFVWKIVPRGLVIICLIVAVIGGANAFYDAHQLDQRRKEIQEIVNP